MKIFVSYTSTDRGWAHWIAWQLRKAGHLPIVHEWEIGPGENIARWMEERLGQADLLIGVFSDTYCKALYSQSERWAAFWQDPGGRNGFLVPVEVSNVTKWPIFVEPLNRLSLVNLDELEAAKRLTLFFEPRQAPLEKPAFPGGSLAPISNPTFIEGGEPLGATPPVFPPKANEKELGAQATTLPTIDLNPSISCINDHEPKPEIFGRDQEIKAIVDALLGGRTTLVAGGPGMGKTAVATAALYNSRVVSHFGRRRVFASLETATESRALLAKLVETLGSPPTGDEVSLLRIVEASAAEKPLAAILDNAETVFDTDRPAAERLLRLLAQLPGLSLAVTIRGVAPHIPGSLEIDDLAKLNAEAARDAFLAVAGDSVRDDPDLPPLLDALDGHALSIRLVAAQATGLPSLTGLRESWDEVHAEILRVLGEQEGRLTSVRASLSLSVNSRRMKSTPLARRLMALIAYLPGGLAERDVPRLLGDRGIITKVRANEAVSCLHQLRLVERRPDRRLRMLTPLRECVKTDLPPLASDRTRIVERYLSLATKAYTIGSRDWEKYREDVEAEADNLDAICGLAVATDISHSRLIGALHGLKEFHTFSGRGGTASVNRAAMRLRGQISQLAAECVQILGDIATAHSDSVSARARYEEALSLFKRIGNSKGEASCIFSLGLVADACSDYKAARAQYEQALALFKRGGDVLGEANCIHALGNIAKAGSDRETAQLRFEEALALSRRIGDALCQANCISELGGLASARSDYETAQTHHLEALPLYRRIGDVIGEANSNFRLGGIATSRYEYETAQSFYKEAIALAQRVGGVLCEANSILALGKFAGAGSDIKTAQVRYEEALTLYRRIGNVVGEANCILYLGNAAAGLSDHKAAHRYYEQALVLYRRIDDLLGEANCTARLMDVAIARSELDTAQKLCEEALAIYRLIGNIGGEANCIAGLGQLAKARSNHELARAHYEESLALWQKIGSLLGEAGCLKELGNIASLHSNHELARLRYTSALALYRRVGETDGEAETTIRLGQVRSETEAAEAIRDIEAGFALYFKNCDSRDQALTGWQAMRLALTSVDAAEVRKYRELAKSSWTAIGRLDLVADWLGST